MKKVEFDQGLKTSKVFDRERWRKDILCFEAAWVINSKEAVQHIAFCFGVTCGWS